MIKLLRHIGRLLKYTYLSWDKNQPFARSAIIAYYTLFSLPSLLMIVVSIAGYFFGKEAVQGRITNQIAGFIGEGSAKAVEGMVKSAALNESGTFTVIFGFGALLFGATGAFFQLKHAMNTIWGVKAKQQTFLRTIKDRAISFGMVLVIGMMLLTSLTISAMLSAFSEYVERYYPDMTAIAVDLLDFVFSFVFITLLFASIFRLLPDIVIRWKITFLGAGITTFLFLIGEYLIGLYFGNANPASVYGGASSVVLILLWVYYTCLILFFGAELTVQYAKSYGENIQPNKHADFIDNKK
ncbi:YihY/virulence factor BrkB family protein [Aquimarina sp. 2-A2]|uniref:YihY/virulence factor BrkB family protein n=1 Tax=Aquimarina sp. 2-A2 TaxID=3382644 RepID=UPI00387EEEBB